MKQRFILEVELEEDEPNRILSYVTEDEKQINFLTYFLKIYDKDMFNLYNCPISIINAKNKANKIKHYIPILNKMIKLNNDLVGCEDLDLIDEDENDVYTLQTILTEILYTIDEKFFNIYNFTYNYYGKPISYNIEDITGKMEITKEDAIKILKEKLNMEVIIID